MEFNRGASIWELMLTKRPSDTHFSQSSTSDGKSPLARDDDGNTLNTHAVLFDGTKTALAIAGTCFALGVVVAPHLRSGLISLKPKLRRRAEEATGAETPVPLTVVAEVEPEHPDPARLRAV